MAEPRRNGVTALRSYGERSTINADTPKPGDKDAQPSALQRPRPAQRIHGRGEKNNAGRFPRTHFYFSAKLIVRWGRGVEPLALPPSFNVSRLALLRLCLTPGLLSPPPMASHQSRLPRHPDTFPLTPALQDAVTPMPSLLPGGIRDGHKQFLNDCRVGP